MDLLTGFTDVVYTIFVSSVLARCEKRRAAVNAVKGRRELSTATGDTMTQTGTTGTKFTGGAHDIPPIAPTAGKLVDKPIKKRGDGDNMKYPGITKAKGGASTDVA